MSMIISTLFDALLSKVFPKIGIPREVTDTLNQIHDDSYDSLVKYTRVEPFCIIDNTLVDQTYTDPLYQVSLNILIAYYLQAVSLINVGNGIPPVRMLRKLSPEGSMLLDGQSLYPTVTGNAYGMLNTEALQRTSRGNGRPTPVATEPRASGVKVNEVKKSNAVVGKSLTIDFDKGDERGTTPITINVRYNIVESPQDLLVSYLSEGSPDQSYVTRIRQLRAGRIRFWRDFVFATDLLDNHRKLLLMDKNNLLKSIIERRGKATAGAALGNGRNYGISSNCLIVSTSTLRQAEGILKGKIDNDSTRNSIFSTLSLLLLVVVDKEYERFTFYFRNNPNATTVSAKTLKSSMSDDKGDSLEALAKALAGNKPVTF